MSVSGTAADECRGTFIMQGENIQIRMTEVGGAFIMRVNTVSIV